MSVTYNVLKSNIPAISGFIVKSLVISIVLALTTYGVFLSISTIADAGWISKISLLNYTIFYFGIVSIFSFIFRE